MKKYSVHSLYVINISKNGVSHNFICKKGTIRGGYFEVLTGERIDVNSSCEIIPLANFYSPLAIRKLPDGEVLKLDKKDILKKYIEINQEHVDIERLLETKDIDSCNLLNIDSLLDQATTKLFPETGQWGSGCFSKPTTVGIPYLPCNSRNDVWMARLLRQNSKLYFISLSRIIKYIKTSEHFKTCRNNYEQRVIKWQIDWMRSGGENWLVSEEYGGDFIDFDENCDIGFRKGIVDTLSSIGMNSDAIEEGIERNASMWRDAYMSSAFRNRYNSIFLTSEPILFSCTEPDEIDNNKRPSRETLEEPSEEFKEKWLRLRKYEYYQVHKKSVDAYGQMDDAFTMTDEEVEKLREEVSKMSEERLARIAKFKERRDDSTPKQYLKTPEQ